ncbi:hypothetical protein [Shewanella cyperi]|uniref:hypothetical protein n=1 Tax=Shewanella cyperi TaxID=2814292 RepID=UPI001A945967|nr:hypothetical protein [Shewanella cyperi]QSX39778.1 hypothetical protein JYB84_12235 [Shewanella cyperi]
MNDIISSWLKDNQVKVTSPVIGAFLSAWLLFNWDKFLLLFWGDESLSARLQAFQDSNSFSDYQFWLWPFVAALIYVFGLPYLNVITQKFRRHAELLRYNEVVDTDIEKEKKLFKLNEERYKSNPDNDYIGRKIKADIEQKESEAKKVAADADSSRAEAEAKSALAEKAKAEAAKAEMELEKQRLVDERERQAHERAKAFHDNQIISAQFPTLYEYLENMSEILVNDGVVLKVEIMRRAIEIAFGFDSKSSILKDKGFNLNALKDLSVVIYDHEYFLSELQDLVESDSTISIDENQLFDYLVTLFETVEHCRLISSESLEDEAISYFEDNQVDVFQSDGLSGPMAETNAYFDEISDYQVNSVNFNVSLNRWEAEMSCVVSGTNHEDKMFYGDSIQTSLIVAFPIVLGNNGAGTPFITDVSGSVIHPD